MRIPVVFRYPNALPLFIPQTDWKPGGAPIQMYTLATELAKDQNFAVYFWFDDLKARKNVEGVELFSVTPPINRGVPILSRYINRKRKAELYEIVGDGVVIFTVCSNPTFLEYQPHIQTHGGKTIYQVASDIDVDESQRDWPGTREFSEALIRANGVIAQTRFQQDQLLENFNKESTVIPPSFRDPEIPLSEKHHILWVGQCTPEKRPWIVLELARANPNENFVMIMPENDTKLAMALKSQLPSLSNVDVTDYVPYEEVQAYYNRAKLVINTSVYEGFPNTLHQACIGRAPYLSLAWNPDNFFERTGIGLSSGNDVNKMVDQLSWLLDNPEQSEAIGERAREYFDSNHRIEVVIKKYKDFIRQVVAR